MILDWISCPSSPCRETESQSACRYTGLRAESVSAVAHLRVEGCGRKGLISHCGLWMDPLGALRAGWQRVAAGSEERGVTKRNMSGSYEEKPAECSFRVVA